MKRVVIHWTKAVSDKNTTLKSIVSLGLDGRFLTLTDDEGGQMVINTDYARWWSVIEDARAASPEQTG